MAGRGAFTTIKLSEHTRTALNLIERCSGRGFHFSETDDGAHLVEVCRPARIGPVADYPVQGNKSGKAVILEVLPLAPCA
jgi:hypothetical protein